MHAFVSRCRSDVHSLFLAMGEQVIERFPLILTLFFLGLRNPLICRDYGNAFFCNPQTKSGCFSSMFLTKLHGFDATY
jgi:hypothetical protein